MPLRWPPSSSSWLACSAATAAMSAVRGGWAAGLSLHLCDVTALILSLLFDQELCGQHQLVPVWHLNSSFALDGAHTLSQNQHRHAKYVAECCVAHKPLSPPAAAAFALCMFCSCRCAWHAGLSCASYQALPASEKGEADLAPQQSNKTPLILPYSACCCILCFCLNTCPTAAAAALVCLHCSQLSLRLARGPQLRRLPGASCKREGRG